MCAHRAAFGFAVVLALALALAMTAPAARAGDADADQQRDAQAFAERLFAGAPGKTGQKTYACFVRVYSADHLARHPLQKVSAMKLLVATESGPDDPVAYWFRLGLKYRNRSGNFDSSGYCGDARIVGDDEPRLGCGVDCDGGSIDVRMAADNKSAMLRVERVRIWRDNDPDEEASHALVAGADDRIFRLDRARLAQCASLVHDREELAAMRQVANRR